MTTAQQSEARHLLQVYAQLPIEPESAEGVYLHCGSRRIIDFYGGPGTFDSMPPKVRSYIVATTAVNVRDWSSGTPFEPSKETLRSIDMPTTVVRGGNGHPAMLRIGELLHASIPAARLVTIAGGSHFLPSSHPAEIAALIRQQVDRTPAT